MARRSTKKFDFGKDIWYFNINKGYNNTITIKRKDKNKAINAFAAYQKNQDCEWLGKWDGKKFVDSNYPTLAKAQQVKIIS